MQYSPKLKMAMEEIKTVLKKYDIAATVILADGQGFSEFLNRLDPSWSGAYIEHTPQGDAMRIRIKKAEIGKEKAKEMADATYNMIVHLGEQLATHAIVFHDMAEMLEAKMDTEKFPGSFSDETEQNN